MADSRRETRVVRETYTMGTRLRVTVEAPTRAEGLRAAEAAVRAVERLDGLLSTWRTGTPLDEVNHAPRGRVVRPPAELAGLLAEAEAWARRTGRAFEPAVGALIDAWDLRGHGRRPDPGTLVAALDATGRRGIRIDPASGSVTRLREGAWIDAGAFGKGAALEAARTALREAGIGSALLDLGGQVVALGTPADAPDGWPVNVADPSERRRPVASLRLMSGSAATSGASERGIEVDGRRLGHVLDPRTGLPVPAWGSVTVVSPDPLAADALATALFVLGPDAALAWATDRPDVAVLVLEHRNGRIRARCNRAMEPHLVEAPGVPPVPTASACDPGGAWATSPRSSATSRGPALPHRAGRAGPPDFRRRRSRPTPLLPLPPLDAVRIGGVPDPRRSSPRGSAGPAPSPPSTESDERNRP